MVTSLFRYPTTLNQVTPYNPKRSQETKYHRQVTNHHHRLIAIHNLHQDTIQKNQATTNPVSTVHHHQQNTTVPHQAITHLKHQNTSTYLTQIITTTTITMAITMIMRILTLSILKRLSSEMFQFTTKKLNIPSKRKKQKSGGPEL